MSFSGLKTAVLRARDAVITEKGGITVPAYTASKSGVAGITKALANEWAKHNVNVNAIAPGYMATNNTAALQDDETRNRQILERIPTGRYTAAGAPITATGTPVASLALHQVADRSERRGIARIERERAHRERAERAHCARAIERALLVDRVDLLVALVELAQPVNTRVCRRRPIVAGQFQRSFDRQFLNHVGGLAHEIAQRNPADQFSELGYRPRKFAGRRW